MTKYNKLKQLLCIWFIIGLLYYALEGVWRIQTGGWANIIMLPIGGLCGLLIGGINQYPRFSNLPVYKQALIGTAIVLIIEYFTGYVLNIKLGLNIWDYSALPLNISGQICLLYGLLWFLLMPFAVWLEDYLRWRLWNEGTYYSIGNIYIRFFLLK